MAEDDSKQERLESDVRDLHLKEEDVDVDMGIIPVAELGKEKGTVTPGRSGTPALFKQPSRSPIKQERPDDSPAVKSDEEETVGGDIELKLEPGKPPKLARTTSHKVGRRPPPLFLDYDDKTAEACAGFDVLSQCTYANKYLGSTEPALECDCAEEWGKSFSIFGRPPIMLSSNSY